MYSWIVHLATNCVHLTLYLFSQGRDWLCINLEIDAASNKQRDSVCFVLCLESFKLLNFLFAHYYAEEENNLEKFAWKKKSLQRSNDGGQERKKPDWEIDIFPQCLLLWWAQLSIIRIINIFATQFFHSFFKEINVCFERKIQWRSVRWWIILVVIQWPLSSCPSFLYFQWNSFDSRKKIIVWKCLEVLSGEKRSFFFISLKLCWLFNVHSLKIKIIFKLNVNIENCESIAYPFSEPLSFSTQIRSVVNTNTLDATTVIM